MPKRMIVAATPGKFGAMTEAERHAFASAFVDAMQDMLPSDAGVAALIDSDQDPVDLLTDDEVRELMQAEAESAYLVAQCQIPPDPRTREEYLAEAAAGTERFLAGRVGPPRGKTVVREHDEIGPVLTRKGDKFSGPPKGNA